MALHEVIPVDLLSVFSGVGYLAGAATALSSLSSPEAERPDFFQMVRADVVLVADALFPASGIDHQDTDAAAWVCYRVKDHLLAHRKLPP